jgi:hypothetical protein
VNEDLLVDAPQFLRHTLATLAYRSEKVLHGAPPEFGAFNVGPTTRTPSEILRHLCDLLEWALSQARGQEKWPDSSSGAWDDDVQRFFATLRTLDEQLAESPLNCPWTRLFQGPIADALTHVGQLALLRRLAGSAIRGENYFKAEIMTGHVGPNQPAPRREFE